MKLDPFARIRPETILKEGSKVGNFVEIKKSIVGKKSKVNHLSYVGDANVGKSVNIGAGTITCNYDGVNKNKTKIKDKVFKGFTIDSNLVAKADKDAIILHCLPAYRAKEITDEVIESKNSRIFEQAENRMHVQQALLACLFSWGYCIFSF